MQAGDLVMIVRTSVGVPANTMGLLINRYSVDSPVWQVQLMDGRSRRYLEVDLEVIK
jgi:hypothetical protein